MALHPQLPSTDRAKWVGKPVAIKILVVDDSVVMRQLISRMLETEPDLEVIGFARDGRDALAKVALYQPDLVTLDVEMPELSGLEALKLIKQQHPKTKIIMCSSLTARGAAVTIDALMSGADDYVAKQRSGEMNVSAFDTLKQDLLGKVRRLFPLTADGHDAPESKLTQLNHLRPPEAFRSSSITSKRSRPQIVAIGVSTGGPSALAELMPAFPTNFPIPIVIVQHMPPYFTASLAERLTRISQIPVIEAKAGMLVERGQALLAPGDYHLRLVKKRGVVEAELNQGERESFCRPAADVLFRSVAEVYGGNVIATILTGMGSDGLAGISQLKGLGAYVLAQNKDTSVVWGMPGAVVGAQLADEVLPLTKIYSSISRLV